MFEWIKGLFKKSASASSENEMVWQPGIIPGVQIGTAFSEIPEVNQSVLFIAQNATQAELGFFAFKDNAELYRDNATVRPVADLLAQPNPNMDLNTFLEFVYGYLAYEREVFILKVKSRGQIAGTRNIPAQLWPINPEKVSVAAYSNEQVTQWSISGIGIVSAEDVIHIRSFNPSDNFRSVSPLKPLEELLKANKAAMKSNRHYYENDSQAPFVIATDQNMTPEQLKKAQETWNAGHKGPENKGKTGFLSGGLKPHALNIGSGTKDFVENSKNTSERILSGFGMQKSLLNFTDTTNYATYMGQLRTFWQNTIRPMVRKVENALNAEIVRPYSTDFELRFKYDNVEAFQADFGEKVSIAKELVSMGFPLNAVSDRLNLGFEPVPWGDDWWINFGLVPASDYDSAESAEDASKSFFKASAEERKEIVWKRFDKEQIRAERLLSQKIGRFFMEQGSRLKRAAKNGELGSFDWEKENKSLEKMLFPAIADSVKIGIENGRKQLEKQSKAGVEEEAERRYLGRVASRILRINNTTRTKCEEVLTQGLTEGKSNEEIAELLATDVLGGFKTRARNIARTESTGALNGGTNEYFAEVGAKKTWLSARDSEVRDAHAELDGETVDANEVFSNGLAFPGDPNATEPGQICNCRCTIMASL